MSQIVFRHAPPIEDNGPSPGVAGLEAVLTRWFDAEVVLTSSGRAAMLLWLTEAGLDRYRDRICVPRMIATCVLDAVIKRGFPIDIVGAPLAEATIFYHQYGFTQAVAPSGGRVLEDICHAFFSTPSSGARDFVGEAAIFSLPKFCGLGAMAGGLLTRDKALAQALRTRRDAFPPLPAEARARHSQIWRESSISGGTPLEILYLERLANPRIADEELAGAPMDIKAIAAVGAQRRVILDAWLRLIPAGYLPDDWRQLLMTTLPFVCPVFGPSEKLARLNQFFSENGFHAGLYQIDTQRNCVAPVLASALLAPTHHRVEINRLIGLRHCFLSA